MIPAKLRTFFAFLFLVGLVASASAASFDIQGISNITALKGYSPPVAAATFSVLQTGSTQAWTARMEGNPAPTWVSLSATSGTGAGAVTLSFNTANLAAGTYASALSLTSGGTVSRRTLTLTVGGLNLVKMVPDLSRPWVYGLHAGTFSDPSYLLPVSTSTGQTGSAISVGTGATDLTVNNQEGRLYISNWSRRVIQVVDLETRALLPPISSGTDVYQLNAGQAGRLYTEGLDQWIYGSILDSSTGALIGNPASLHAGDGELDPSGRFYYHCDAGHSGAEITKYDISADTWNWGITGRSDAADFAYGSRNLLMSPDGRRLFWVGLMYDADLNLLRKLGPEIHATNRRGTLAVTDQQILSADTGEPLAMLPVTTDVSVVAGDQTALFYFNPEAKTVESLSLLTIAPPPEPGSDSLPPLNAARLSPLPALGWEYVPGAVKYQVYLGRDVDLVRTATPGSPEYAGETQNNFWNPDPASVPPGGTFFWRVDAVRLTGTAAGMIRTFKTVAVTIPPAAVTASVLDGAPAGHLRLPVSGVPGTQWGAAGSGAEWLKVLTPSGVTGGILELEVNPGGLPPGSYTADVTLSADGLSGVFPVKFTVEPLNLKAMKAHPARPEIYALQWRTTESGALVVVGAGGGIIEKVIPLSGGPSDLDFTPDNRYLYVVTKDGRLMHRINLDDWTVSAQPLAETSGPVDGDFRFHVAAGAESKVFWVDGWHLLHSMDFATGQETSPPISSDQQYYGFGRISRNADGTKLMGYTHSSSSDVSAKPLLVDVSGMAPRLEWSGNWKDQRYAPNAPVLVGPDDSGVIMRSNKFSSDLTTILKEYPSEVYAATKDQEILFGARAAWRERSLRRVWEAPGNIDASVSTVAGDQSAFYYFDAQNAKLVRVPLSSLGDLPGPRPEDGEVITTMPAILTWTPHPMALRYEIYFGTDPSVVDAAADSSSPTCLGTANTASFSISQPFTAGGLWWWRVDTVLPGSTIKGPVWRFSGALKHLATLPNDPVRRYFQQASLALDGTTLLVGLGNVPTYSTVGGEVLIYEKVVGREDWERTGVIPPPSNASQQFGRAVAMKDGIAWIGSPGGTAGDRIYEYRRDSLTRQWTATGRNISGFVSGSGFGSSLAFKGNLLAVAAPGDSSTYGSVDVYDAATLTRLAHLAGTAPYSNSYGNVMALGDAFLAVGAPSRGDALTSPYPYPLSEAGAVDIWAPDVNGVWIRSAVIPPPPDFQWGNFGASLAVSGKTLFVGTPSRISGGTVYPYENSGGGAWTALPPINGPVFPRELPFTSTLAAAGDNLVTGTPPQDYYGKMETGISSVWLQRRTGRQSWTPVAPAMASTNLNLPKMGLALALSDRYLAVLHADNYTSGPGVSVYLHNPAANLPPSFVSPPHLFAEQGLAYQSVLSARDENQGDKLKFSVSSPLPQWLTLLDQGDGTARLSGTPPPGAVGIAGIRIEVRDSATATAVLAFDLRVLPAGGIPQVTAISGDQVISDGKRVELSVTVSGGEASYQWYFNGAALAGELKPTLVITRAQVSDSGVYYARVTRGGVWTDSAPMSLTVNQIPDRFGGDWPTYGAGNSRSGGYPATLGAHKFLPAWEVAKAGQTQVATGGGRIYIVGTKEFPLSGVFLSAYELYSGTLLWTCALPSASSLNPPAYHRGRVYLQMGGSFYDPKMICVDAASGVILWQSTFVNQWQMYYYAPVVTDNAIYAQGGFYGGMYGFDLEGNQLFFNASLPERVMPLFHRDGLYSCSEGVFRLHDQRSGQPVAEIRLPTTIGAGGVAAAEGSLAVVSTVRELFGLDLDQNSRLWSHAGNYRSPAVLRNGITYIYGADGVESYNVRTGVPGQRFSVPGETATREYTPTQLVALDDTLILSSEHYLWVFDLISGRTLQQLNWGASALTYTDGILLAISPQGALRAWRVNQASVPTASTPNLNATEDVALDWTLTVTDPDGDLPAISAAGLPGWLKMGPLIQGAAHFTGIPSNEDHGPFSFTVTADDHLSVPVSVTVQGFVTAVDDRPTVRMPAPVMVDEDEAIPPLNLEDIFDDEEDGSAGLIFGVYYYSNPGALFWAGTDGRQLKVATSPNLNGEGAVTVTAVDSSGQDTTILIPVIVRPVNDSPFFYSAVPDVTADAAGETTVVEIGNLVADPDIGDSLTWHVVASSNPALFKKLEFDGLGRLTIEYALWISGQSTITVEVRDAAGSAARSTFMVTLPEIPSPVATAADSPVWNSQVRLWEQVITVRNPGAGAIGGFEIGITGLPAGTALHNASSSAHGTAVVAYGQALAGGGAVTLVLEYEASAESPAFQPGLAVSPVNPDTTQALAGAGPRIDRAEMSAPGVFLLEFTTVPGELYMVQHLEPGGVWTDSPPRVRAAGTRVQWNDKGALRTPSAPGAGKSRFYRVRHPANP